MTATSFRVRAPLRCDGIGRLDCAEDPAGARLAVRWLPLDANGEQAMKACERLPAHPTLPKIRQTGTQDGKAFVALDFPEGQLLSARLGERLALHEVIQFARQLADALACVHEQNVVHGELGGESVLLAEGKAYLWDMPLVIANRLTDRRGESRLMHNLGRMGPYLAPERARGGGASKESDVYSLGAILCVAAGAPLPSQTSTLGVVHQVATGLWAPKVPLFVPEPWCGMLERMLQADPSLRPTAKEAATAFSHEPTVGLPTVPELQALQLPAEVLAAAEAQAKQQNEQLAQAEIPEVSESQVVKLPTLEIGKPTVQLTDTISVHADLALKATVQTGTPGAVKSSAEKPAKATGPAKLPYVLIGGLGFGIITLLSAAVVLATSAPPVATPTVSAPVEAPAPQTPAVTLEAPAPVEPPSAVEDEVAPLPAPVKKAPRAAGPNVPSAPAQKSADAASVEAPAPVQETVKPQPTAASDFNFLAE